MVRHRSSRCAIIQANYHLVFIPKYRKPVLTGPMVPRLHEIWKEQSEKNKFEVIIAEIMPDHVHLFLEVLPSIAVSKAVQHIKGSSGYKLRKEFPDHIRKFYWKAVFWAPKYFLRSVGDITAQTAVRYIEFQKNHHHKDSSSTNDQIKAAKIRFKTLDNWFNLKIMPRLEK